MDFSEYVSIIQIEDVRLINISIFLIIYEYLFISFLLLFYNYKTQEQQTNLIENKILFFKTPTGLISIFILFFILILIFNFNETINQRVLVTIFDRNLTANFSSLVNINSFGFFEKISFTLFNFIYPIFIFLISISMFHVFKKKFNENFFIIFMIMFILSINILIVNITTSKFQIFIYLFAYFIILSIFFKKIFKYLVYLMSILILLAFFQVYVQKSDILLFVNDTQIQVFSKLLQAYIPNITNVAISLDIKANIDQKITAFFSDLYQTIPFRNTLIGIEVKEGFSHYLSIQNTDYFIGSQISPNLNYGYFYFGIFLSPIISIVMIYLALTFQKYMLRSNNFYDFSLYTFMCVQIIFSVFIYNFYTFVSKYLAFYLPILIILKLVKKVRLSNI